MKCEKCSTELKEEDKFCPACGKKIDNHKNEKSNITEKKFNWRFVVIPLLIIIIGLNFVGLFNSKIASEKGQKVNEPLAKEKKQSLTTQRLKTEGKEKEDVFQLKEDAIQVFSTSNNGHAYDIYLIQEEVVKEENTEGDHAREGDILETSELVFYLGEKGESTAYRQQQLEPLSFVRNLSLQSSTGNEWYENLQFEDFQIIALYEYLDIFSYRQFHLFDVVNGELTKIPTDEMNYPYYYPQVKALGNDKLQMVLLEESSEFDWIYETYEYNREQTTLQLYNEQRYDAEDLFENLLGLIIFEHWEEHQDAFVPYTKDNDQKNWDLDEVLNKVDSGRFGDLPVKVGDAMIDVYNKNKAISRITPTHRFGISLEVTYDGYQVGYNPIKEDVAYFEGELDADFRGPVRYIRIPEEYTTFTMRDVIKKLGTTENHLKAEEYYTDENYYGYQLDQYTLIFGEKPNEDGVSVVITDSEDLESYVSF